MSAKGEFAFDTIKPGVVPDPDGNSQAPHIFLAVITRGMPLQLYTRIYFENEAEKNAADPDLTFVPAERRATLIARHEARIIGSTYTCRGTMKRSFSTCKYRIGLTTSRTPVATLSALNEQQSRRPFYHVAIHRRTTKDSINGTGNHLRGRM
jgi:hypothetical protein